MYCPNRPSNTEECGDNNVTLHLTDLMCLYIYCTFNLLQFLDIRDDFVLFTVNLQYLHGDGDDRNPVESEGWNPWKSTLLDFRLMEKNVAELWYGLVGFQLLKDVCSNFTDMDCISFSVNPFATKFTCFLSHLS